MTTNDVRWTWDSQVTTVTRLGHQLRGYRVLTTNLDEAFLFGPNMNGTHHGHLSGATVVPEGDGWRVSGVNDAGQPEEWSVEPLPRSGGCGSCGGRRG